MKKILITVLILVACMQLNERANAQVSNLTNCSTPANEILGWWPCLLSTPKHLDISNGFPAMWDMRFFTNAGAGPVPINERMRILGANGFVGIGTPLPANQLEINTPNTPLTPNAYGGTGFSGLRFSDLKNGVSTPCTYAAFGNLSIDANGDVIYVKPTGIGYCGVSGTGLTPLINDGGYNLYDGVNWHNLIIDGNGSGGTSDASVIIGNPCGTIPQGKVDILQYSNINGAGSSYGLFVNNVDNWSTALYTYGIGSYIPPSANDGRFVGLDVNVQGSWFNCGVFSIAQGYANPNQANNQYNLGGYFGAWNGVAPCCGPANVGIYADLGLGGPYTSPPDYAGYFNGDLATSAGFYTPSDSTLKQNIHDLSNPMSVINALHPKTFSYQQAQHISMQLPNGTHAGLISQEVEQILPNLVKTSAHPARYDSVGNVTYPAIPVKFLNYTEIIPYLIAGMKQQDSTIHALQDQINNCCNSQINAPRHNDGGSGSNGNGNSIDKLETPMNNHTMVLSSNDAQLFQNEPNPYKNTTTIRYYIPQNVVSATIIFVDDFGKTIAKEMISERGNIGELNIDATTLAAGTYSYSLVLDNVISSTRRMVHTK